MNAQVVTDLKKGFLDLKKTDNLCVHAGTLYVSCLGFMRLSCSRVVWLTYYTVESSTVRSKSGSLCMVSDNW